MAKKPRAESVVSKPIPTSVIEAKAPAEAPPKALKTTARAERAKVLYDVQINGGNAGGQGLVSLDELGPIVRHHLVDNRESSVQLSVSAIRGPGGRADGVPRPETLRERDRRLARP